MIDVHEATANTPKLTKTLARCKPTEFVAQCVKIKNLAEKWLKDVDIISVWDNSPDLKPIPDNATAEEREAINRENGKTVIETYKDRFLKLFDRMFVENPYETLSLLALTCFVEPENIDNYEMADYMDAVREMWQDRAVVDFFTFLASLVQKFISKRYKA